MGFSYDLPPRWDLPNYGEVPDDIIYGSQWTPEEVRKYGSNKKPIHRFGDGREETIDINKQMEIAHQIMRENFELLRKLANEKSD
jgi:hypothetical protein